MEQNDSLPPFLRAVKRGERPKHLPILPDFVDDIVGHVPKTEILSADNYRSIQIELKNLHTRNKNNVDTYSTEVYKCHGALIRSLDKFFETVYEKRHTKNFLLSSSMKDGKRVLYKKGTRLQMMADELFRAITDDKLQLRVGESTKANVKRIGFLTSAPPKKKRNQLVHSSTKWDIATMSMRGIKSCMNWEAPQCQSLKGSIIDPCLSLVYITDGTETTLGRKMLYRAVIRMIRKSNKPGYFLLIDRIYTTTGSAMPKKTKKRVVSIIKSSLQNRMGTAFEGILIADEEVLGYCYIPLTQAIRELDYESRSYVDCPLPYEEEPK